jgi:lipopolysaccharide/colanic/teichoic acid biosynthesis glycosyltransferase
MTVRFNLKRAPSMNNTRWKRVNDLIVACTLTVLALPVMAIIALAIKLESAGPVFYQQERVGLRGRRFILLKFRSMVHDAEPDGQPVWAAEHDLRITRLGLYLRSRHLDELPQLFNVLWGDMSMVGPRPERPYFVDRLTKMIPSFPERLNVNPGITGWAQIHYPYTASIEDARRKLSYDLYYIRNRSFILDVVILLSTVRVIISQRARDNRSLRTIGKLGLSSGQRSIELGQHSNRTGCLAEEPTYGQRTGAVPSPSMI